MASLEQTFTPGTPSLNKPPKSFAQPPDCGGSGLEAGGGEMCSFSQKIDCTFCLKAAIFENEAESLKIRALSGKIKLLPHIH